MFFNYQHFWGQWAYPKATAIIRTRFLKMPRRLTIMRAAEPSMLLFPTFQFILHHIEEVTSNRHNDDDDGDLRQIWWLPNERPEERDLVVLPNRAQRDGRQRHRTFKTRVPSLWRPNFFFLLVIRRIKLFQMMCGASFVIIVRGNNLALLQSHFNRIHEHNRHIHTHCTHTDTRSSFLDKYQFLIHFQNQFMNYGKSFIEELLWIIHGFAAAQLLHKSTFHSNVTNLAFYIKLFKFTVFDTPKIMVNTEYCSERCNVS